MRRQTYIVFDDMFGRMVYSDYKMTSFWYYAWELGPVKIGIGD